MMPWLNRWAVIKHQVAVGVGQAVEGDNGALDEGFHDIVCLRFGGKESVQIGVAVQTERVQRPDPGIGFGHHRISGYPDQAAGFCRSRDHPAGGHGNPGGLETAFHQGFTFDDVDIPPADAGDVEIVPDAGFGGQPVFVEGFEPVDLPVAVGEVTAGPDQPVVVVHVRQPVVFGQGLLYCRVQTLGRGVSDAQHRGTHLFQVFAEPMVVVGKVGRQIDDVHWDFLIACTNRFRGESAW
jgi:hypothetical protein